MSKPITPAALNVVNNPSHFEVFQMLQSIGVTGKVFEEVENLASDHREAILAANTIRRYAEFGGIHDAAMSAGGELREAAMRSPFLTKNERVAFTSPETRAVRGGKSKKPRRTPGFVYLMLNTRNGLYKIGFSKNPTFREATLQSQEPEVRLVFKTPGTITDERRVQSWYFQKLARGEWYALAERDVEDIRAHFSK